MGKSLALLGLGVVVGLGLAVGLYYYLAQREVIDPILELTPPPRPPAEDLKDFYDGNRGAQEWKPEDGLPFTFVQIGFTRDYHLKASSNFLDGGSWGYLFEDSEGAQFALTLLRNYVDMGPFEPSGSYHEHPYVYIGAPGPGDDKGLVVPPNSRTTAFLSEFVWILLEDYYSKEFLWYLLEVEHDQAMVVIKAMHQLEDRVNERLSYLLYLYRALNQR